MLGSKRRERVSEELSIRPSKKVTLAFPAAGTTLAAAAIQALPDLMKTFEAQPAPKQQAAPPSQNPAPRKQRPAQTIQGNGNIQIGDGNANITIDR